MVLDIPNISRLARPVGRCQRQPSYKSMAQRHASVCRRLTSLASSLSGFVDISASPRILCAVDSLHVGVLPNINLNGSFNYVVCISGDVSAYTIQAMWPVCIVVLVHANVPTVVSLLRSLAQCSNAMHLVRAKEVSVQQQHS